MSGVYGRYGADPSDALGRGISSLGDSIAGAIMSRRKADAEDERQTAAAGIIGDLVRTDESGKAPIDNIKGQRDMLAWLDKSYGLDKVIRTGQLPAIMTMVTNPVGEGPDVVTMPWDTYARDVMKMPELASANPGGIIKFNRKTGDADWLKAPEKPAAPTEPKWQHVGNGMFVDMNDPSKPPVDQQEVYRRELESRKAGAGSTTVTVGGADQSKLPDAVRTSYSQTRATLSQMRESFAALRQYDPGFLDRVGGAAGIMGPEGAAADSARNALLFGVAKLAEQGALQAPDKEVAEAMIGQIFDPRIGSAARQAKHAQFERWLNAIEDANEGRIATAPPSEAPTAQPGAPAAQRAAPSKSGGSKIAGRFRGAK